MIFAVAAAASLAAEVLAFVNGKPITRADLEASLNDVARQGYHETVADLRDYEHAAVRDYLGRQAVERDASQRQLPPDSIYARVMANDFNRFDANLRNHVQQQRERVYSAERAALDALIQQRLFDAAARARGMTAAELTRALTRQAPPVTKRDVDFIKAYENSKQEALDTVAPGEERLAVAIRRARVEQMRLAVIDSVRGRAKVDSRLAAPRVVIPTANASLVGPPTAPVRIVVFTDFECPYCLESEGMLSRLRAEYGERVALYYFNYPLPNHTHARPAAVAAECAAAMGKYSAYHDLLFSHSTDLAHPDYAGWAESLGLDRGTFESCLASGEAGKEVDSDIREGIAAGVAATPTFLVNGRLVPNTESLPDIVEEEVAATR